MATLLVTFVGLPGTGKTALCCRVVQILHRRGVPCKQSDETAFRRLTHKLAWAIREALGHPRYAVRSVRAIAATRQGCLLDFAKMITNWLARSFLIRRSARTPGIHLFDEGLFQALWSIGFSARKDSWPAFLPTPLLYTPSLTIILESSLATVEHRLAERPGYASRLEKRYCEEPGLLMKADRVLGVIKDVIAGFKAQRPGLHVVVVDNDRQDAFEANALCIADRIQALYDGWERNSATGRSKPNQRHRSVDQRPSEDRAAAASPRAT